MLLAEKAKYSNKHSQKIIDLDEKIQAKKNVIKYAEDTLK